MQPSSKSQPTGSFFTRFTYFLKALWIFFPGIIFLLVALFIFIKLPQGKDIIYQSTDVKNSWLTGLYIVLSTIFWVFTTWYTARLIAYDRDDLYQEAPWVLYHFPRLLGFCIFLVLWLAVFLINDIEGKRGWVAWVVTVADLLIYAVFHHYLEHSLVKSISNNRRRRLIIIRYVVRALIVTSCLIVILEWNNNNVNILLYTLPVFQLGFLFLVIVRHPLFASNPRHKIQEHEKTFSTKVSFWERYIRWTFAPDFTKTDLQFEKPIFLIYHILVAIAVFCYLMSINYLPFARGLTSFPLVLLAFGILLGIINLLALISYRKRVNVNFLVISLVIIMGFIFETHAVRLKTVKESSDQLYAKRPKFRTYLENWLTDRKQQIDSVSQYPVFLTLADGGASRSGYWAALVLSTLHEKTRTDKNSNHSFFLDHLFCLSGASGGSVGNATFLAGIKVQQQHPELKVDSLCVGYLDNDFLAFPLARLLGPDLIKPVFGWVPGWGDRAAALEVGMDFPSDKDGYMAHIMRNDFGSLIPGPGNRLPVLCINTTRVSDGGPGVVSTMHIDSSNVFISRKKAGQQNDTTYIDSNRVFGKRIDVLQMVPAGNAMRVSTAMVLGARFPYMSPGGKLGDSYFVDGGYFDNSGAGVVHEMLLEMNRIANDTTDVLHTTVKKLQFYVIHLSNSPYAQPESSQGIHPALNDLATPLLTLAGSYSSQTSINDARLINYLKEINKERKSYIIFNLYKKDTVESISMNWVISNRARKIMFERKDTKPALDSLISRLKQGKNENLFKDFDQEN